MGWDSMSLPTQTSLGFWDSLSLMILVVFSNHKDSLMREKRPDQDMLKERQEMGISEDSWKGGETVLAVKETADKQKSRVQYVC